MRDLGVVGWFQVEPADSRPGGWIASDVEAGKHPVASAAALLGSIETDAIIIPRPSVHNNVMEWDDTAGGPGTRGADHSKSSRAALRRGSEMLMHEGEKRRRSLELVDGRVQDLGEMLLAIYRCARTRGEGRVLH